MEKWKVKYSKLFTKKFITDSIYWDGVINILNKDLHEVLEVDPLMILIIFFCYLITFLLTGEFPQNMIPYSIIEWKWEEYIILSVDISLRNYMGPDKFCYYWIYICLPFHMIILT